MRKAIEEREPAAGTEPPPSQASQAYLALENLIVMGTLKAGTWLSELSVSNSLGIGRTPVREALKSLERDNLVEIVPSRGIRVKELHTFEQLQMLEVRRPLEKMISQRAAALGREEQRQKVIEASERTMTLIEAGDRVAAMSSNRDCCRIIWEMCGNPYLVQTIRPLFSSTRRFFIHYSDSQQLAWVEQLHRQHAVAIAKGGKRAVDKAFEELMDYLESFARSVLEREAGRINIKYSSRAALV